MADTPAPRKPVAPVSHIGYAFPDKQEKTFSDPMVAYSGLAMAAGGHYPLGAHGFFHGGIHFDAGTANAFSQDKGVRCVADGEVVAYRIDSRYRDATSPGMENVAKTGISRPYSTGFVLVRHRLQPPLPPAPLAPPPESTLTAFGTQLCDRPGGAVVGWLPHGARLRVETTNDNGTWAKVAEIVSEDQVYWHSASAPQQPGWVRAYDLTAVPAQGLWNKLLSGDERLVNTAADIPDPRQVRAQGAARDAKEQHAQARAAITAPPTLTLYSLYMHVADYDSYRTQAARERPGWWNGPCTYRVKPSNKDAHPRHKHPGLNVRSEPSAKSDKIGWLGREAEVTLTGVTSEDGKWGQVADTVKGETDFFPSPPALTHRGWVYLCGLDAQTTPDACDQVVCLKAPHPIRAGALIGFLGQDVPWYTRLIGGTPASRPLLHLEIFSGEDVYDFIAQSRAWDAKLPDAQRTLLALKKGDALHLKPDAGSATVATLRADLPARPLAALKSEKDAAGKLWRQLSVRSDTGTTTGWVQEEGHRCSPWAWHGAYVVDQLSSDTGAWWDDAKAAADFFLGKAERPPETAFAKAIRGWMGTNHDGATDERELDAALRNPTIAPLLGAIIARHRSAWDVPSWEERFAALDAVARHIGASAVQQQISAEKPRVLALRWWKDVAAGVTAFPQNSRVYHFHPVGLAGAFLSGTCACHRTLTIEDFSEVLDSSTTTHGLFTKSSHSELRGLRATDVLPILNSAMERFGISDCLDKAFFLANLAIECDRFKTTEEYKGRGGAIPSHWNNYKGGPEYHGRGLIQLTHKYNYDAYFESEGKSTATDISLVATDLSMVTGSSCWYWRNGSSWGDLSSRSRERDFLYTILGVNGGFNHAAERQTYALRLIRLLGVQECDKHGGAYTAFAFSKSALSRSKSATKIWKRYFGESDQITN